MSVCVKLFHAECQMTPKETLSQHLHSFHFSFNKPNVRSDVDAKI